MFQRLKLELAQGYNVCVVPVTMHYADGAYDGMMPVSRWITPIPHYVSLKSSGSGQLADAITMDAVH